MTRPLRVAAALLATSMAFASGPARAEVPPVERLTTPDGHEVIHAPLPDAPYGQVTFFWPGTAALDVQGKEGLYTLGAQLPLERAGGRSFDEIAEDLTDAGANLILTNLLHGTALVLQSGEDDLSAAAEVARDVLGDPALAPEDLDFLKRGIEDGLAETERDPALMAQRAMGALISGDDPRLAALTDRPFETVEAVTTEDVRDWMEETFDDAPLIVSVGPMEEEAVAEAVDAVLADLPAPSGEPDTPDPIPFEGGGTTVAVRAPEADVAVLLVPFLLPSYTPEGAAAFSALAGGDGARLFERVREQEGASYGLELGLIQLLPDQQVVTIGGAVPLERVGEVVAIIREEVARLREEGLTQDEIDAAREEQLAALAEWNTDPNSVISVVLDQLMLGQEPALGAGAERARALTVETANAALPYLLPEAVPAVVVTPDPEAANPDCVVDVPEEAADCVR